MTKKEIYTKVHNKKTYSVVCITNSIRISAVDSEDPQHYRTLYDYYIIVNGVKACVIKNSFTPIKHVDDARYMIDKYIYDNKEIKPSLWQIIKNLLKRLF